MRTFRTDLVAVLMLGVALLFAAGSAQADPVQAAGTVTLVAGHATAATSSGEIRNLFRGGKVYPGETLITASSSYMNVEFSDGGRVLLRPESRFVIERYQYDTKAASETTSNTETQHESAFFRLLKGGFRAVSGLIGHVRRQDYSVQTPVATIGIRGTDYEVRYCAGDCADIQPTPKDGLYAGVQSGGIALTNQNGQVTALAGQFTYVAGAQVAPIPLPLRPPALGKNPLPDPRTCN
ncbi:MAG TPA: FecR domain-containing protein [Gammaproteobacteria bacterium]|nr:FecR domain-containing protein [Gammaproteobacteria bacterium]